MAEDFARSLRAKRYRPRTIGLYVRTIERLAWWLREHGSDLRRLTTEELLDYAATLPFTYASQQRLANAVKAYWRHHLKRASPCPAESIRCPTKPPMVYRGLEPEEARALVAASRAQGSAPHVATSLLYYAGLRVGEVAEMLRASDRGDSLWIVGKGAQTRVVPVHDYLRAALDTYVQNLNGSRWVFPGRLGDTHISTMTVTTWVRVAGFQALGKRVTPHQLRYTYGAAILDGTGNLRLAGEMLGHSKSSISVTAGYTRTRRLEKREALGAL